jgi:hypothetical protein
MRKAPAIAGAFLCSVASIAVWVKLMRHVDVVVGTGFAWFRDLTGFMWHEASVEKTNFLYGMKSKGNGQQ